MTRGNIMSEQIEALKLALEALYPIAYNTTDDPRSQANKAITAIKKALAQPEQEPVVCCQQYDTCLQPCTPRGEHLAQRTEQEPVAWRAPNWSNLHGKYGYRDFDDPVTDINGKPSPYNEPLYTHPQRTWVGLTDEEISALWNEMKDAICLDHKSWAKAIENKLKEKNT